jgi:Aldehyde dehydrogenase family
LIVHESVRDELIAKVVARAESIKQSDPTEADTEMGPGANQPRYEKVLAYLDGARSEGATIACGGEPNAELGGLFVRPTVVLADPDNTIVREEVFGSVLAAYTITDEDDAVRLANDSRLRPGRGGVGQGRAPRPPRCPAHPRRHGVDQRLPGGRPEHALRRLRPVRHRARERHRRGQRVPRHEVGVGGAHGGTRDPCQLG